ncbi:hypothetical protein ACF3NS_05960 [Arsenicicoccus cauae]|nr:hypothetical protein [Arsenicicoccus cauae]
MTNQATSRQDADPRDAPRRGEHGVGHLHAICSLAHAPILP